MAGRTFPIKIGGRNSGTNHRIFNGLRSGRIRHNVDGRLWWRQVVRFSDLTLPASTSGTFSFDDLFPANAFYDNVQMRPGAHVYVGENWQGGAITALTIAMGGVFADGTDGDGLLTATSMFAAGTVGTKLCTPAAAEYETETIEAGFEPTFTLASTTANLNAITQGWFEAFIPYSPLRS